MSRRAVARGALTMIAVFVVYVIAGKLGLALAVVHASATAVWAPTGIALATLLVLGYRFWPAIFAGAVVVNLTTEGSLATSLGIAAGNTLEAVVGVSLVNRFASGRRVFHRPQDTFKFAALGGIVAPVVSATAGVTSLALGGYAAWSAYTAIWLTWWLGDAAGALVVTPLLVLWSEERALAWRGWQLIEAGALLVSTVVIGEIVFAGHSPLGSNRYPLAFLCLPALVWAAFRFGPREAATAIAILSAIAIRGTVRGSGPFAPYEPNDSLVMLQAFMATMAMVTVPMAAVVSEWRRSRQALARNEELFRRLADSVPVMVWMSGPDARCTFFNRAWVAFTGRTMDEEELDQAWTQGIIHPEDAERRARVYRAAFDARGPVAIEYRLRRADSTYRWVSEEGVPRLGARGVFEGYTGGCLDIHDRKRAERRLRAQYAAARIIAEAASLPEAASRTLEAVGTSLGWDVAGVWWVDRAANVIRYGAVWHAPSIRAPEFMAATRAAAFSPGVGLPGRVWQEPKAVWIADVAADPNFPRAAAAVRDGLRGAFAFPILVAGHCLGVIEVFSRESEPPDEDLLQMVGNVGAQLGQFAERTRSEVEVRASEDRTAAMVRAALDAIVTMDDGGRIVEFNPAAESMFGRRRADVIGLEMAEVIIPTQLRQLHREGLARYLATGEGPVLGRRIEITALRAGGEEFPVELAIARMPSSGPPLFTGYVRDITDRRRAEEQRAQLLLRAHEARTEAEAASRLKDDFLATLSHELRTPLNAIVGWSRMLMGGQLDRPGVERAINVIDRNARMQVQIIEDLLDVSRIITGQLRLEVEPVDLVLLIEQSLDVVRPAAEGKRITLLTSLDRHLPALLGDRQRLQQVIWNLLSNAVKFTPEQGRVEVRLAHSGRQASITVLDTGKGVSAEFLPYIFDRFRQADSTTTRTHGGLGLGLAIVRQLVELHGGTVHAENRTDTEGAVFTVTLPLREAVARGNLAAARPDEADQALLAARLARLDGLRVLAVDDEADALELATAFLTLAGASVTSARTVGEALDAVSRLRPDVVLCDIAMPGEDGYAFIRRLRGLADSGQAGVPVVALTAHARAEDRARARQAGFDAHLAKPTDPIALCEAILQVTRRRPPGSPPLPPPSNPS